MVLGGSFVHAVCDVLAERFRCLSHSPVWLLSSDLRMVQSDLPSLADALTCASRRRCCSPGLAAALAENIEMERKKKQFVVVSSETSRE
jgi:hypothetical protein